MKFQSIITLAFLAGFSQVQAKSPKVKVTTYDEEHCQGLGKTLDVTVEEGHCKDFDSFRSIQVKPHKKIEKIDSGCDVQIFDGEDCMGRMVLYPQVTENPDVCANTTFAISAGAHSGRSVKFLCGQKKKPTSPVLSTLVEVPFLSTTLLKTETQTLSSSLKPTSSPPIISVVHVVDSSSSPPEGKIFTTTKTRGQLHTATSSPSESVSSYSSTSTVWIQPQQTSTETKVIFAPAVKKSHTLTLTTFFKGNPVPSPKA